jgi:hypothetical protein
VGVLAICWMRLVSLTAPVEPKNPASPKAKIPPSDAAIQ